MNRRLVGSVVCWLLVACTDDEQPTESPEGAESSGTDAAIGTGAADASVADAAIVDADVDSGHTDPGPIRPALVASRTSGPAPLAVHFDATDTTTTDATVDPFRQLTYTFDFGDDRGLTWQTTGLPKNRQSGGPIGAHVFDVPGTYTVKARIEDSAGHAAEATTVITVTDPSAIYAGAKTLCISVNSDFTDCPAGAVHRNQLPTKAEWNETRVLFHRGQNFSSLGGMSIQDGNAGVQVGAFGVGARPVVHSVGVGNERPQTANFATDVTVMDLAVDHYLAQAVGSRVLFYRNQLTNNATTDTLRISFGDDYWTFDDNQYRIVPKNAFSITREIFVVENTIVDDAPANGTPQYGVFGFGSRVAILGNVTSTFTFHDVRLVRVHKGLVAHNELRGVSSSGGYHALKIHSGGLGAYADDAPTAGQSWASRHVVVADNILGSAKGNNAWQVMLSPQNDQSAEGIEDAIVENNRFVRSSATQADLCLTGRRLTYRGNLRTDSGALAYVFDAHGAALPAAWRGPYFAK